MEIDFYKTITGLAVAIIAFFLIRVFNRIDKIESVTYDNKGDISLLKQESINNKSYFNEKFEMLFHELREMRSEFKQSNK